MRRKQVFVAPFLVLHPVILLLHSVPTLMILSFDDLLSKSCGQVRPISLLASFIHDKKITEFVINKPYAIIGRHASCDVSLPHLELSKQHVYLQVLDGRLFCVDQASRTGIFWKDKPRLYGWLDAGQWIKVGPYRITLKEPVGTANARAKDARNTAPFLTRYKTLPKTAAQLVLDDSLTLPLQSQMTVIGRSKYCNLELQEENISRVHASIVKTSEGKYWLIELMSRIGVKINGKRCHSVLLNHNDIIKIGSYSIQFQDITKPEINRPLAEHNPSVQITPIIVPQPLEPTLQEVPVLNSLAMDVSQASVPTLEPITVALASDAVTLSEPLPFEEQSIVAPAEDTSPPAEVDLPEVPGSDVLAMDDETSAGIPLEVLEELVSDVLADDAELPVEEIPFEDSPSDSMSMDVVQPGEVNHSEDLVSAVPELEVADQVETELPSPVAMEADAIQPAEVELPREPASIESPLDIAGQDEVEEPVPADLAVETNQPVEVELPEVSVSVMPVLDVAEQVEIDLPQQLAPYDLAIDGNQPTTVKLPEEVVSSVPAVDIADQAEWPEQPAPVALEVAADQQAEVSLPEEPVSVALISDVGDQTEVELPEQPVPVVQAVVVSEPSKATTALPADIVRAGQHLALQHTPSVPDAIVVKKTTENNPEIPARATSVPGQMVVRHRSSLVKPKSSVFIPPHVKLAPPAVQHRDQLSNHFVSDDFGLMDGLMQCMKQMQQEMMSQMRMNMEMMAEFMGNLQKQQAEMIRDELAQLGKLNTELLELRQSLLTAAPPVKEESQRQPATPARLPGNARVSTETVPGTTAKVPRSKKKIERPDQSPVQEATTPLRSHAWISQRISCLEQERLTRWEKMKTAVMGK